MEDEKQEFQDELQSHNDPIENWPIQKLKKEAEGDMGKGQTIDGGMGQAQERDEIGIE